MKGSVIIRKKNFKYLILKLFFDDNMAITTGAEIAQLVFIILYLIVLAPIQLPIYAILGTYLYKYYKTKGKIQDLLYIIEPNYFLLIVLGTNAAGLLIFFLRMYFTEYNFLEVCLFTAVALITLFLCVIATMFIITRLAEVIQEDWDIFEIFNNNKKVKWEDQN